MKKVTVGIIVFPGSNCDQDAAHAFSLAGANRIQMIWHKEASILDSDILVLPGGFSYGDYLRSGAIAGRSPIMKEVIKFASQGRPVIGICNGFQILIEAGLLKGNLIRNVHQKFVCKHVKVRVERNDTPFSSLYKKDEVLTFPIAHDEGNYYAIAEAIEEIESENLVAFRYTNSNGSTCKESNPNGSTNHIAGIYNKNKNILGLMPHPERASEKSLGSDHGLPLFSSLISFVHS